MKDFLLSMLVAGMVLSCQQNREQADSNPRVKNVHEDVPFEQEYHEGYIIDPNRSQWVSRK